MQANLSARSRYLLTPLSPITIAKSAIITVWGGSIILRLEDLWDGWTNGYGDIFPLSQTAVVRIRRADIIDISLSACLILLSLNLIGRRRNAWMIVMLSILAAKIVSLFAHLSVGITPVSDTFTSNVASAILPAIVLFLLYQSRRESPSALEA